MEKKGNSLIEILIAVFTAVVISLLLVIVAAFVIKICNIGEGAIIVINQVIKGVSVLLACIICLRSPKNGWIRGFAVGIVYIALAFVVFSLLSGEFVFDLSLINDCVLGGASGLISGIIAVNLRRHEG